jgi:predicted dehydrogenase
MSDLRDINIGVIGAGGRGGLAHHSHKPDEACRLVAAADLNDKALADFREKFGKETITSHDYRDVLARPDVQAVFITSPDYLHEEHAVAALEAGKAVYLEKPMAITTTGCDRILDVAVATGGKLYLGHNMRHMPFVQKMKELVDDGAIGEVKAGWCRHFVGYGGDAYFKDWHADRSKSTSLLLQKGAHDIDVLHWLCGGYTQRVSAMGGLTVYDRITDRHAPEERGDASWHFENWPPLSQTGMNPVLDVEDISMMMMQLDNGVFASYQQCHFTPDGWRNYTIIGTEGRIENLGENDVHLWNKRRHYDAEGDHHFSVPMDVGNHGGADPRIVNEFIRYVREGSSTKTSPIAARNSVAAGCAATKSLRNRSIPVDVKPANADAIRYFEQGISK